MPTNKSNNLKKYHGATFEIKRHTFNMKKLLPLIEQTTLTGTEQTTLYTE